MKIIAIIQARMSSTRLPGKIMRDLGGKPVLLNIVERVRRSKLLDDVIVATSVESSDDEVERFLQGNRISYYRGSLDNVLERFYVCASENHADVIVRLTADNALVASEIIDEAIKVFTEKNVDYLYYKSSLPLGMCIEIFTFSALKKAYEEANDPECLEHVTPYIKNNRKLFKTLIYREPSDDDCANLRFTMDTQEDYNFVSLIYESFENNEFSYLDILSILDKNPSWKDINSQVTQKIVGYAGER